MHDLDRVQLEFDPEDTYEDAYEDTGEGLFFETDGLAGEGPFSEESEMNLATQLLEVIDEQEMDQFLGNLIKKATSAAGRFFATPAGQALKGILKNAAKKALPVVGGALGSMVGGPAGGMLGGKLASMAGKYFGLELEGLSDEDQAFEVARRYVRFAGAAARNAARGYAGVAPNIAARNAVIEAAKKYAPGFIRRADNSAYSPFYQRGTSGRWLRRGTKIVLYGVYA